MLFHFPKNRTVTEPLELFKPKILRYNEYIKNHLYDYKDLYMWHYKKSGKEKSKSKNFPVNQIPTEWIVEGNFISVGKHFRTSIVKITERHLREILKTFDRLLPIYEYIEIDKINEQPIENRMSRICWNSEGWIKPTGKEGKSKYKESFEFQHNYGHEEWLFD